jgi:proteic killer suppression protein
MIKSFADSETEKLLNGEFSSKLPKEIQPVARRKLRMINNAQIISDLRIPPANRLEKLKGNLKGVYSIRINKQWRIVFQWIRKNAEQVKTEDYYDQTTKHTPWGSSNRRIS